MDAPVQAAAPLHTPPAAPARILVAEGNELNQFLVTSMLKKLGHSVTVVNHGQAVLDALARNIYDLVLMDCRMPGMDGYTASRKIRGSQAWSSIPVVALTANAMPDDRRRCFAARMNGYLTKMREKPAPLGAGWIALRRDSAVHTGVCWFSMYRLTTARGAPPHEAQK